MGYVVYFENIGTAPAQIVRIDDQLDTVHHDLSTLTLEAIAFGDRRIPLTLPPGQTDLDLLIDLRPDQNLILQVNTSLNQTTGVLTWELNSIDPETFELPDYDGFLPANTVPPQGEGHVMYSIGLKAGLAPGTAINAGATASIVFDDNPAIETNDWVNTLDDAPPQSQVSPLAAIQPSENFSVSWGGNDAGLSGIKNYDLYVSVNEGSPIRWIRGTTQTAAEFSGQNGASYRFYGIARDYCDNVESMPLNADAETAIVIPDRDEDGIPDSDDNCPDVPNEGQDDNDGDGVGNACDNCPDQHNSDQTDSDGNGVGDVCETSGLIGDVDHDGQVCRTDMMRIMEYRNQPATVCPECDLDSDGRITVLDARKVVLHCSLPRCVCN
jgi:hypothetical protein